MDLQRALIEPKDYELSGKTFVLTKIPADEAFDLLYDKAGEFFKKASQIDDETRRKIFSYIAVRTENGNLLFLTTRDLIRNHVPPGFDAVVVLMKAEVAYNTDFFTLERASSFFEDIAQRIKPKAVEMLTQFWQQLSPKDTPPSES